MIDQAGEAALFVGKVCVLISIACLLGLAVEWIRASRAPKRVTVHDVPDWRDPTRDFIGGTGIPRARVMHHRLKSNGGRSAGTADPLSTHGGSHESFSRK